MIDDRYEVYIGDINPMRGKFTFGRSYTVCVDGTSLPLINYYYVADDDGILYNYRTEAFVSLATWREHLINSVIDKVIDGR